MSSIYFNTYFFTDRSRIAILHRKLRTLILMKCQVYYERQCGVGTKTLDFQPRCCESDACFN